MQTQQSLGQPIGDLKQVWSIEIVQCCSLSHRCGFLHEGCDLKQQGRSWKSLAQGCLQTTRLTSGHQVLP